MKKSDSAALTMNACRRLSFVIDFAQMDLRSLKKEKWASLRVQLSMFLAGERDIAKGHILFSTSDIQDADTPSIFRLQLETRELLQQLVRNRNVTAGGELRVSQVRVDGLDCVIVPALDSFDWKTDTRLCVGRNQLWISGPPRDAFLMTLLLLLVNESTDRIRVCPECERIFLRIRRQEFCSSRCVDRRNKRQWRSERKNRLLETRQARERYARLRKKARTKKRA